MKINSKEILAALKKISPAVGSNKIIPICEYVRIDASGKEATVTATNLNLTCISKFQLLEDSKETILVPFDELEKICSLTSEIDIDKKLKISFDGEYQILGTPEDANLFPVIPTFENSITFDVDCNFFFSLSQAAKSTNTDSSTSLYNVFLENDDDGLSIFSYGQGTLYVDRQERKTKDVFGAAITPDFIKAVRMLQDATISISENKIKAESNGYSVICTLADCTRLGYKVVYNRDRTPNFSVVRNDLMLAIQKSETVKTTSLFHQINIYLEKNKLTIEKSDKDLNREGKYYCACDNKSDVERIIFNSSILKNAISQTTADVLQIKFIASGEAIIITDENVSVFVSPMVQQ